MLTARRWILDPPQPRPGDPGPIAIRDSKAPASVATVCLIAGKRECRREDGTTVRLLDEDDIAQARLISAAPRLRSAIEALLRWAAHMGDWEAPCWRQAKAVLRDLNSVPDE